MSYEEVFESVGWTYMGPCACRREKGFIFQDPEKKENQLWIYPLRHKIKVRQFDITKQVVEYSPDTMETVIKALASVEIAQS